MGRSQDGSDRWATKPASATEDGADAPEGMGLSSEHDQGQIQEVDSREEH
ncbi:MAG TPA: hypothetical protein VNP20_23025 [Nocardioidaceae bacterium]|nr:hypothetical protein [Nocardioidaceae bacterium]